MKSVTACTLDCPDSCSLVLEMVDGKPKVRGNPKHPFTKGICCVKGMRFPKRLNSGDRITEPMLRHKSGFAVISWDEALAKCAEKIQECRTVPESILHLHGHGYRGVLASVSTYFFSHLGASAYRGSLCDDTGIEACIRDFGSLNHNDPFELLNAEHIVNWGKDLSRSSLHTGMLVRDARKKGARVLTISPGGDGNAEFSDRLIRIHPGTDRFLAAAIIRELEQGAGFSKDIMEKTSQPEAFLGRIREHSTEVLLQACGVAPEDFQEIVQAYAATGPTASIIGWGVQRHLFGGENVRYINALALLSGNIGRSGGGSYFNISSGRNLNLSWADSGAERRRLLLPRLGKEIMEAQPEIKMIWVDGFNPVNQIPAADEVARAFEQCDFVVTVDGFMTDTAVRSDLVLPPSLGMEHDEILGSCLHDYVQFSAGVLEPPEGCLSDHEMLQRLGGMLEPKIQVPELEELFRMSLDSEVLSISLEELKEQGFVRAERPSIAYEGLRFDHPDGKYCFPEALNPEPEADEEYPDRLLTLVRKNYMHSQIPEMELRDLPTVHISREHAGAELFEAGEAADLVTPRGKLRVLVEFCDGLHPRSVILRRGGWMKSLTNANPIISAQITDMSESAAYYSQQCRLIPSK